MSAAAESAKWSPSPAALLEAAWASAGRAGTVGSSTALIARVERGASRIHIANLGDADALLLRRGGAVSAAWGIAARTATQQVAFNQPFQLGFGGQGHSRRFQAPADAQIYEWPATAGDVLLIASDGLADNVDDAELLEEVGAWAEGPRAADASDLALRLVTRARQQSLDSSRDGPFARAAKDNDICWNHGGRPDDVTVLVALLEVGAKSAQPAQPAPPPRTRTLGARWDALVPSNLAVGRPSPLRRAFSTSNAAPGASGDDAGLPERPGRRVARITLSVPDIRAASTFYTEALKLRSRPEAGLASAAILSAGDASSCCDLRIMTRAGVSAAAPTAAGEDADDNDLGPRQIELRFPYLTFGVSNLKTSARHAQRKLGAAVEAEAVAPESAAGVPTPCMHFLDPVGRSMRVLHLFRRNPTLSITLGVASIDTSRRLYEGVLGMRELSTEELVGLYLPLPPPPPLRRLALTLGDPHSTTSVVLEEVSPQAAAGRRESDDKAPLLGFEVPAESLAGLHEAVALSGLEVSPFDAAEHRSFAVQDEDGYVLHVVARV